ncbi:50S ribosomal protein L4 [Halarsenatibacter silvermanii]|uniref:Large ribosomal subunit protein uL4 n=1 Tax=Halarsenatibacter silvermanii TaxID=321763 RepID=A0A1G9NAF6_9FIRM|nr:50S ribosomal protein L4 [Halarsenatibacter silvermanii]SDL83097.1 LSU ribosomal protein L4P [Halarsenatibacter silvermanii]
MPEVNMINTAGENIDTVDLSDDIFAEEINEHVVHKVVTAQLAARRQGTASTKERPEVAGGGRKPWRQKGTGRARHGSIRSPIWVGGGVTFGPKPRSYEKKVNKKTKKLALRSVLSAKLQEDELIILDELEFEKPCTRDAKSLLEDLGMDEKKLLFILPEKDENTYLSFRNIPSARTLVLDALNTYDLLDNEMIVMPEAALSRLEEVVFCG